MPGFFPKALHPDNLGPVRVQPVYIHIAVQPTPADELFQRGFGQSSNIHSFFSDEVDELAQPPGLAGFVATEQGLCPVAAHMDAGRSTAAWALARDNGIQVKTASVQIFLHLGDNHVPLAHQHPVSGH